MFFEVQCLLIYFIYFCLWQCNSFLCLQLSTDVFFSNKCITFGRLKPLLTVLPSVLSYFFVVVYLLLFRISCSVLSCASYLTDWCWIHCECALIYPFIMYWTILKADGRKNAQLNVTTLNSFAVMYVCVICVPRVMIDWIVRVLFVNESAQR